jgi:hypothetical protein
MAKQMRAIMNEQGKGLCLFRNGHGSQVAFPGHQEACRTNAPGPKRHKSGTIPAKFIVWETLGAANCPRFIKINGVN